MANEKIYSIKINGITESINAVDALNKQLNTLESRIKALESSSVKVGSSGGGSKASSLSEEEKLAKQIEQIDAKREAYSKEIYQNYLAAKDVLKETVNDQKQLAAAERVQANVYSNTMEGMKQKLADLKSIHFTTDISTDEFKKQTQEINDITQALKKLEEEYGVFSRNVGNYKSAADGFTKFKVQVGDTVREFSSAREASKQLKQELLSLDEGAEGAQELREAIQQVDSAIKDLNKSSAVMDNLLDTMESFTAIANVGQGIRGLFGVDDAEMQKSIKNLVALQNVLKGIETINKQINTREGIGKWIAPFNTQIDKATAKLLAFNTSLLGTSKAAKAASIAIKGFGKALKLAFSAGILIVVDLLVDGIMKLVESFNKVDEAAERAKEVQKDLSEAYGNAKGKIIQYTNAINNFNGTTKQENKLVEDLNREFGSTLGTYKTLSEWKKVLKEKGDAYIQTLVNQAKAQAAVNEVTAAYINLTKTQQDIESGKYKHWYATAGQEREAEAYALEQANERIKKAEENLKKIVTENEEFMEKNGLGNYAPQIAKNGNKSENALKEVNKALTNLELSLMKDGLTKKLKQLDEDERQTINKLKENGRKSANEIKKVEAAFSQARLHEINEYLKKLEESISQKSKDIKKIRFEINIKDFENQIDELENKIEKIGHNQPIQNTLITSLETKNLIKNIPSEKFDVAKIYENLFDEGLVTGDGTKFYNFLLSYLKQKNKEVKEEVLNIYNTTDGDVVAKQKTMFDKLGEMFEQEYSNELLIIRNYTQEANQTLSQSFERRIRGQRVYEDQILKVQMKSVNEQGKLTDLMLKEQKEATLTAEKEKYDEVYKQQLKNKEALENTIKNFTPRNEKEEKALKKLEEDLKTLEQQILDDEINFSEKSAQINDEYNNKIIKNETDTVIKRNQIQAKYYSNQISNLRDMNSKLNEEISKQPTYDKFGFGIINPIATRKSLKEVQTSAIYTLKTIREEKQKLDRDWKNGLITPEEKNATIAQLNDIEKDVSGTLNNVGEELKNLPADFIDSVNNWVQMVGQGISSIMSSLSEITQNQYEAQISEQEKYIEQYEKLLDKQKEATQKYADEVNSIEDELKTARGDRRQELIDQLNAQMAAQRASYAEEKRIEKQKEKAEEQKKKLEHDQAVAKKRMDLAQAYINAAMAVSMAAVNKWPIPAVPMMTMAAAATAAQIAAIQSQNIPSYGSGGLLEGKSHKEGGIKTSIGSSPIELEGQEYVIRKRSTADNIPVLDFINRSERKLNLGDFIDFYSSNKVKKSIVSANPRTKFESGGMLPLMTNDIELNDRLVNVMEDYSNRPVVVSVVDINDRQAAVRNVEVLSGLNE